MMGEQGSPGFPVELWRMTVEILRSDDDYVTMSRLTQTCKFFQELTIPELYRRVTVGKPRTDITKPDSLPRFLSAAQLVRTAASNKELAGLVEELVISDWKDELLGQEKLDNDDGHPRWFLDACQRLGLWINFGFFPQPLDWKTLSLEVLICLLPSLKSIDTCRRVNTNSAPLCLDQWMSFSSSNRLKSLTSLTFRNSMGDRSLNWESFRSLTRAAPNVQQAYLYDFAGSPSHAPPWKILRELHLEDANVHAKTLTHFMRHMRRLQCFRYISGGPSVGYQLAPEVTPADLASALLPFRETLEHLEIDMGKSHQLKERDMSGTIESLRDFALLETVTLSQDTLFRPTGPTSSTDGMRLTSVLPASTVKVRIQNVHANMFADFHRFAQEAARGMFPGLRTVQCSGLPPKATMGTLFMKHETLSKHQQEIINGYLSQSGVRFVFSNS